MLFSSRPVTCNTVCLSFLDLLSRWQRRKVCVYVRESERERVEQESKCYEHRIPL